jgi:biopolymer transport protein ExbD
MITRPLELASQLRPEPRNLDWLHFVNAGLLVLFFSLFGSRFVLAPGLGVDLRQMSGSRAGAAPTTHYISVTHSGVIFTNDGPVTLEGLKGWLKEEAKKAPHPSLLVRADAGVKTGEFADIASAAWAAGFSVVWATEEPAAGASGGR